MEKQGTIQPINRTGVGNNGERIMIKTNLFAVNKFITTNVYHYNISLQPDDKSVKFKKYFFKELIKRDFSGHFGDIVPMFDGASSIYTNAEFPFGEQLMFNTKFSSRQQIEYIVMIKRVAIIKMYDLVRYLNTGVSDDNMHLSAISALDVSLRTDSILNRVSYGRCFYTPAGMINIDYMLDIWVGYYQALKATSTGLYLNIDTNFSAFYHETNMINLIMKMLNIKNMNCINNLTSLQIYTIAPFLVGLNVQLTYRNHNRNFLIRGVTKTEAQNTMFDFNGNQISVVQYFREMLNMDVKFPLLPCIIISNQSYFPFEVCRISSGQRFPKKLSKEQNLFMMSKTVIKPDKKESIIIQGVDILNFQNSIYSRAFDFQMDPNMATIPARILPPPTLLYKDNEQLTPYQGQWNINDVKAFDSSIMDNWSIISFVPNIRCPETAINNFINSLKKACHDFGMGYQEKVGLEYLCMGPNVDKFLEQHYHKMSNVISNPIKLIIIILKDDSQQNYARIKVFADSNRIRTQCVQVTHVYKAKLKYCQNLILKINVKLGGINSCLLSPIFPNDQQPFIIIGADVSHPPLGDTCGSITALTASTNSYATRYIACVKEQGQETYIFHLEKMMITILREFYHINQGHPAMKIIFYRDGVSEGQFSEILEKELGSIKSACTKINPNYNPQISFIVVQKKHHVRFFPISNDTKDKSGNCIPGTVIDTTIIHPTLYDFYLQSHLGIMGTSRPAHYYVLIDENNLTAEEMQKMTNDLCYLYSRSSSAVSIVSPVYYANLVSFRAGMIRRIRNGSENKQDFQINDELTIRPWMYFV